MLLAGWLPNANKYQTPKVVEIHDWKLGFLRQLFYILVFLYIVPYQVLFVGKHLSESYVSGVVKVLLREPTRKGCDAFDVDCVPEFDRLSDLPYCKQNNYSGVYQKRCEFRDQVDLRQLTDEGIVIPSHILTYNQTRNCNPAQDSCDGRLYNFLDSDGKVQESKGHPEPIKEIFVADVERFKVMFDHSAHSDAGVMMYSFQMVGSWMNCTDPDDRDAHCKEEPILCVHKHCPEGSLTSRNMERALGITPSTDNTKESDVSLAVKAAKTIKTPDASRLAVDHDDAAGVVQWRRPTASSTDETPSDVSLAVKTTNARLSADPHESEYTIVQRFLQDELAVSAYSGDVFAIGQLLKVAGAPLDEAQTHDTNETYRAGGFALVVRIRYSNLEPWMGLKVLPWQSKGPRMRYSYHITKRATGDHALRKTVHESANGDDRLVEEYRGVRIVVQQYGNILVWDEMHLLVILTTTLALLAASSCILETVALNFLERSSEYAARKFERDSEASCSGSQA